MVSRTCRDKSLRGRAQGGACRGHDRCLPGDRRSHASLSRPRIPTRGTTAGREPRAAKAVVAHVPPASCKGPFTCAKPLLTDAAASLIAAGRAARPRAVLNRKGSPHVTLEAGARDRGRPDRRHLRLALPASRQPERRRGRERSQAGRRARARHGRGGHDQGRADLPQCARHRAGAQYGQRECANQRATQGLALQRGRGDRGRRTDRGDRPAHVPGRARPGGREKEAGCGPAVGVEEHAAALRGPYRQAFRVRAGPREPAPERAPAGSPARSRRCGDHDRAHPARLHADHRTDQRHRGHCARSMSATWSRPTPQPRSSC